MTSETSYEILIGTYEEFVLGYQLIKTEDEEKKYTLTQTFVTHSHTASVRSVAATSKLAASSGADETVVLYDMVKRKQSGALMQHEGTITCLKFTPEGSHLISCSDDGSIAMFRVGSWQLEKLFKKAHKGTAVNHIAIHPSGKLALSVGKDKTLRTWNLIKGRPAYITNLSSYGVAFENLDLVVWSPEGLLYAIPIQTKAVVFSVEKAGVLHTLASSCKVHCVCFLNESTVVTGNEESSITCYNIQDGSTLWTVKASKSRVKGLSMHKHHLIAITSAGDLVVYDVTTPLEEPVVLAASNDGCRFTCLTIRPPVVDDDADPTAVQPKKKKKKTSISNPAPPESSTQLVSFESEPQPSDQSNGSDADIEVVDISVGQGKKQKGKKSMDRVKQRKSDVDSETETGSKKTKSRKSIDRVKQRKPDVDSETELEETGSKKNKSRKRKSTRKEDSEMNDSDRDDIAVSAKEAKKILKGKLKFVKAKEGLVEAVVPRTSKKEKAGEAVRDEFVDISAPRKKKVDHAKMVAKKKKRQGHVGKG